MQDLEPYEIFQIELLDCTSVDSFYGAASRYFDIPGPNLWDIFAVMSNYDRNDDRLQYVENHVFANDLIKQDMIIYWFNTLFKEYPDHQKQHNM